MFLAEGGPLGEGSVARFDGLGRDISAGSLERSMEITLEAMSGGS